MPASDEWSGETPDCASRRSRKSLAVLVDMALNQGGAETIALEVACYVNPKRFARTLIATRRRPADVSRESEDAAREELSRHDAALLQLDRRSRLQIGAWFKLYRFLRTERVDILHCQKFGSNLWGSLIGPVAGVPVVIAHEHSRDFAQNRLRAWFDRRVISRRADAIVAVSRQDRAQMIETVRIDPAKVIYIPNGIDAASPTPGRDMRSELQIPPDAPVVGTVAILRQEKALEVLLEAAAALRSEFPALRLVIVGDGDARSDLERDAVRHGVSDMTMFLGARNDVTDVLTAFDVAVLSSDREGMPLSVLEYMAASKAIVSTRVGAVPDMLAGDAGLLVNRRDPRGMADAIARPLRDPALRHRLEQAARRRYEQQFTRQKMIDAFEALYDRLSAAKRSPGEPST